MLAPESYVFRICRLAFIRTNTILRKLTLYTVSTGLFTGVIAVLVLAALKANQIELLLVSSTLYGGCKYTPIVPSAQLTPHLTLCYRRSNCYARKVSVLYCRPKPRTPSNFSPQFAFPITYTGLATKSSRQGGGRLH